MKNVQVICGLMLAFFLISPVAYAQGGSGQGGSGGNASGGENSTPTPTLYGEREQEREQEQKQIQEPGEAETMEQEREQEREMRQEHVSSTTDGSHQLIQNREQEREMRQVRLATSTEHLRLMIQERKQEQEREEEGLGEEEREMVRNQHRSMLAAEVLTMAGNMYGNRSQHMQMLVDEFLDSQEQAHMAEEQLAGQGAVSRFFFGADDEATETMQSAAEENRARIQEMKQVLDECDCEEPLRETLQEQLQLMEGEQVRLEEYAQERKGNRGVFGFLFGWLVD